LERNANRPTTDKIVMTMMTADDERERVGIGTKFNERRNGEQVSETIRNLIHE
jgi:hypothetical protein